jgi:PLP dependent protein
VAIDRSGEIATNLEAVRDQISKTASIAGRALDEITLIAVTKTFPASDVEILRDLGVNDFGENRDADAAPKAAAVGGTWHFQGQIQSNKLKSITSWANVIHSLDEIRHFEVIEKSAPYPLDIFCQVSLDGSAGRGGVSEQKLYELAQAIEKSATHRLQGLMAVAPLGVDPSDAFSKLSVIHKAFMADFPKADKLSAGMSGDFKEAIAYGATHIRIGSSILGSR